MIVWGVLCIIGFSAGHFMLAHQVGMKWMYVVMFPLAAIGLTLSFIFDYKIKKREKQNGVIPYLRKQIDLLWWILVINGLLWTTTGMFKPLFADPRFIWAMIYGFGLSITGVLYSKEWLYGGIAVFAAILVSIFIRSYSFLILGFAMGLGCIIPSIIALKRLRRLENENEQA